MPGQLQESPNGGGEPTDEAALADPTLVTEEVVETPNVKTDLRYDHEGRNGKMVRHYDISRDKTFELLFKKLKAKYRQ
jgi:hypothetical protein